MKIQKYNLKTRLFSFFIPFRKSKTFLTVKDQKDELKLYIGDKIFDLYFNPRESDKELKLPLIYPYKKGNKWILVANNEWEKLKGNLKRSTIWFAFEMVDILSKNNLSKIDAITYRNCFLERSRLDMDLVEYFVILQSLFIPKLTKDCYLEEERQLMDVNCFNGFLRLLEELLLENLVFERSIEKYKELKNKYNPLKYTRTFFPSEWNTFNKRVYFLIKKYAHHSY